MYTFGSTSAVLSDGRVHDGEWHNATVVVTGKLRLLYKDRELIYTSKVLIYAASYSILSFNLSNGGCNLYRKPSDTKVG